MILQLQATNDHQPSAVQEVPIEVQYLYQYINMNTLYLQQLYILILQLQTTNGLQPSAVQEVPTEVQYLYEYININTLNRH